MYIYHHQNSKKRSVLHYKRLYFRNDNMYMYM